MLSKTTVILPAATPQWEVWTCAGSRGCEWQATVEDPAGSLNGHPVIAALPARACRTFVFSAPTHDRQLVRQLAFAQLEKRGLTGGNSASQPVFDCHVHGQRDGHTLVSVDVVLDDVAPGVTAKARGLMPLGRLFTLPEKKLVLMEEQGRLVLCVGLEGRLVHNQVISTSRQINARVISELRIAGLTLQQQGVIDDITGVVLWGDFTAEEAAQVTERLGWPAQVQARPAPEPKAVERAASTRLLPPAARQAARTRRRRQINTLAGVAALVLLGGWLFSKHQALLRLEKRAAELEAQVNAAPAANEDAGQKRIRAIQQQWNDLRLALEPRRYPLMHLNALTRCQSAGEVVIRRFESKISQITVLGTARSAGDAYAYFNAIRADKELSLYGWSMVQPRLEEDGSAFFEITGKLR